MVLSTESRQIKTYHMKLKYIIYPTAKADLLDTPLKLSN